MSDQFTEVAVTGVPVGGRYSYRVPPHLASRVAVGARVLVQFGSRKITGVVVRERVPPPDGVKIVDVTDVLDTDAPALTPELVELCAWITDYYEAAPGEVMKAALPVGTGVESRQVVELTDAGRAALDGEGAAIPDKQRDVLARLARVTPIAKLTPAVRKVVDALVAAGLAQTRDAREAPRAKLKTERVAALAAGIDVLATRETLRRSPKRLAVIDALAAAGAPMPLDALERHVTGAKGAVAELSKAKLVVVSEREAALVPVAVGMTLAASSGAASAGAGSAGMSTDATSTDATSNDAASTDAISTDAISTDAASADPAAHPMVGAAIPTLTDEQTVAVDAIVAALGTPKPAPFLLHGVTGSGKTEVYLRVIAAALAQGHTAVVLVPEISLTPQLAARFRARFGDQVAILHSGLSEPARLAEWSRLRRGEAHIAVGARSAIFAPVERLGVIVVDEEHDGSFKQDEGVKYHARDVALVRAQRAGAVCVLGSATPSLESYAHAERGAYRKLVLANRPTARPMPAVEVVDLRTYMPDGDAMLSAPLRVALRDTLAAGDQAILFLNRRGFATFVLCRACGHSFRCSNCSVSLTYHRYSDRLTCHYCAHTERVPDVCPECKARETIERKGLGTEKIADAVVAEFPTARVARLDRDVASGARVEPVLSRVARREVDILVGTQMVTKGHDFPGVTLVGVLCADTGLNLPDFRASERTFQLLAQVAGRAGRGDRPGRVIVQTYRPSEPAVVAAAAHDYGQFFAAETAARAELGYPPHGRLIAIRIDGKDSHEVAGTAQRVAQLAERLARDVGVEVRGPVPAPIERLRNRTRWQVWLRAADRQALRRVARGAAAVEVARDVRVALDVDPLSAL